jgi:hypothetical protein
LLCICSTGSCKQIWRGVATALGQSDQFGSKRSSSGGTPATFSGACIHNGKRNESSRGSCASRNGQITLKANVHESHAQNEVSRILDDLEFYHLAEVSPVTEENMFPQMAGRKKMIAIAFDGPSHFYETLGWESDGVRERRHKSQASVSGASGMEHGQYSIFRLGQSQKQRSKTLICI